MSVHLIYILSSSKALGYDENICLYIYVYLYIDAYIYIYIYTNYTFRPWFLMKGNNYQISKSPDIKSSQQPISAPLPRSSKFLLVCPTPTSVCMYVCIYIYIYIYKHINSHAHITSFFPLSTSIYEQLRQIISLGCDILSCLMHTYEQLKKTVSLGCDKN